MAIAENLEKVNVSVFRDLELRKRRDLEAPVDYAEYEKMSRFVEDNDEMCLVC